MSTTPAAQPGAPRRLALPPDLARVVEVREWVEEVAKDWLSESRLFDLQVTVSEATANAIEHAASQVELTAWVLPDRLIVEITNDGVFQPGLYKDHDGRRRGLGLPLMVSLADQVHVSRLGSDKTQVSVTFFLDGYRQPTQEVAPLVLPAEPGARAEKPLHKPVVALLPLPIALLILSTAVLYALGTSGGWDSAALLTAGNTLFLSAASIVIAYLAARSHQVTGSFAILALGAGALVFGIGFVVAGPLISERNNSVTFHNTTVLVGGALFLLSALWTWRGRRSEVQAAPQRVVILVYSALFAFMVLLAVLTAIGDLPPFFVDGQGYTVLRHVVLGLGVLALLAASAFFGLVYRRQPSRFVILCALGFAMIGASLGALVLTGAVSGSPLVWIGRAGQWVGGIYLVVAVLTIERSGVALLPLERSLQEIQDRYKNLVEVSPDAITVSVDDTFVFANPAAARLFGVGSPQELLGSSSLDHVHPEDRSSMAGRMANVLAGALAPPAEIRIQRPDGIAVAAEVTRSRVEFGGRLAVQSVYRDITERKRAEEREEAQRQLLLTAQKEQDLLFSEMLDGWAVHEIILDGHGEPCDYRFLAVNPAFERLTGLRGPDVIGKTVLEIIPDLEPSWIERYGRVALTGEEVHFESNAEALGRTYEVTAYRPREGRFATIFRDITERKLAEAALSENEQRFRLLVEQAADGIFLADAQGRYTDANTSGLEMLGYTLQELRELTVTDVIVPEEVPRMPEQMESLAGGTVLKNEWRFRRKDGSTFTGEVVGRQLPDGGLLGILRDVTERRRAEEAWRRSEERLSRSQEIAHLGSWELDLNRNELTWSDEVYRVFGLEPQEFGATYEAFLDRVHPDDRQKVDEAYTSSLRENRDTYEIEHRVVRKNSGEVRTVYEKCQHFRDANGNIIRSVGMVHDITERKRAEEALKESEERHRQLAEENERLYRQQLDIAENLQAAFLHIPSELGPVRLGHLYRSATEAARIGGDFYDVFQVKEGKIALLMGDVAGHGIEAARAATLVKDVVHAFIHQTPRTNDVLRRTNRLLIEKGLPGYVTLFLGILDTETGELRYSSAGHPDMLVRRALGEIEHLGAGSSPLGIYDDAAWKPSAVELQADDLLVLFTDGVIEARHDGELFGEKRLERLISSKRIPAESLPQVILDRVLAFSGGMLRDDLAILTLRLTTKAEAGASR